MNEETRTLFDLVLRNLEGLPKNDRDVVEHLVDHNEAGEAFYTLTTQIYEWQVPIAKATYSRLVAIASHLGLDNDVLLLIHDELVE